MSSIITNQSAMSALQAFRSVTKGLGKLQTDMSTGYRISEASHNAAYWSISTTMKSDVRASSSVMDALARTTALVDVTYPATTQIENNLSLIKERLILAQDPNLDRQKIQSEIDQLVEQTFTVVTSASFGGMNLLTTEVVDLWDAPLEGRSQQFVSAYTRGADGPTVRSLGIDLLQTSMTNSFGGGILERDPRSPLTLGGIRNARIVDGELGYNKGNSYEGGRRDQI